MESQIPWDEDVSYLAAPFDFKCPCCGHVTRRVYRWFLKPRRCLKCKAAIDATKFIHTATDVESAKTTSRRLSRKPH